MNERRLRKFDLNLLVAFCVLMRERHVGRAAERMFLGQPAMSNTLNRLRLAFNDRLFIYSGGALQPTPRALELAGPITRALDEIEQALHPEPPAGL